MKKVLLLSLALATSMILSPKTAEATNVNHMRMPVLSVGEDATERKFTWYGDRKQGYLYIKEFDGNYSLANVPYMMAETTLETNVYGDSRSEVTLKNLKYGTEYIMNTYNGSHSETYRFKIPENGDFNFLLVGDPQIGSSNYEKDAEGWEETLSKMKKTNQNAAFILSVGDQVNNYTNKYEKQENEYRYFTEAQSLEGFTLAPVIGNHDNETRGFSEHFNLPNETKLGKTTAGSNYYYIYENTLFIALNSNNLNIAEHDKTIEDAINYAASKGVDIKWKVVTFHHSIYSAASHAIDKSILDRRNVYVPVLEKHGIDVVLMGHDHVYVRTHIMDGFNPIVETDEAGNVPNEYINPKGILYLTVNSASGSKYYGLMNEQFPYVAVKNQEKTKNYTSINVTDTSFEAITYRTDNGTVVDSVKLIKKAPELLITKIEELNTINVPYETPLDKISLPVKIGAILSDGSKKDLDVVWSMDTYESTKTGEQSFIGKYQLPEGISGEKPVIRLIINVLEKNQPKPDPVPTPKENYENLWLLMAPIGNNSGDETLPKIESPEIPFILPTDISNHWAELPIREVVKNKLMDSIDEKFYPNREATRMEVVKALALVEKINFNEFTGTSLADINSNSNESAIVNWAIKNKIINGFEDGTFKPYQSISREEIAKILVEYVDKFKEQTDLGFKRDFTDEDEISDWAKYYVEKSQKLNLLKGRDDGKFDPKSSLTRGEIAQIVYRLMNK